MKLASRPLLTQSITTAVLFATGDTMAQQLVEKKGFRNHDLARSGRMALYGGGGFALSNLKTSPLTNNFSQLSSVQLQPPGSSFCKTRSSSQTRTLKLLPGLLATKRSLPAPTCSSS
jgi:hypothetical protein